MYQIIFNKVKEPHGWLGNMSPYVIQYNDKEWKTAEALFQALRFEDEEIIETIRSQKSPMTAKMKAKAYKEKLIVTPMSSQDLLNMELVLRLKIEQHPGLANLLIATKPAVIIENIGTRNGERHLFWGARFFENKWEGQNNLGKIWMKIRNEL
jgi:ribA/ribD-fused uncharacterized protein